MNFIARTGLPRSALLFYRTKVTIPKSMEAMQARQKRLKPKVPKDKFVQLATQFLDRVEGAVEPLKPPMNEQFDLDRQNASLTVRSNGKDFLVEIVKQKQQLHFTSPISGLRQYEWNTRTNRWEDITDSHDLEGLFTRDLMRTCSGIPNF